MIKLNSLVFSLVLIAVFCGGILSESKSEKKVDEITQVAPQSWSDWESLDQSPYGNFKSYRKHEAGYILEVHQWANDSYVGWYYEIVPVDDTAKEVITSMPAFFSSHEHAIQSCEARYKSLLEDTEKR